MSPKPISCRLILSDSGNAAMNMALDEALLESAAADAQASPVLRIYRWARPTLSLGYFQQAADRQSHPPSRDCDLVRRPSGGGAILHDEELTYALVLPASLAQREAASRWYDEVHQALVTAIKELTGAVAQLCDRPSCRRASDEPFLCFQRRSSGDVLLGENKIAGSAQRRRRKAILQHGSVLLRRSSYAPQLPGLADLADVVITYEQLSSSLCRLLGEGLQFDLQNSSLAEEELEAAEVLQAGKYASEAWTMRR